MVIGDSISAGRGDQYGPTPQPGTFQEWNGNTFINVTNTDVSTAIEGSSWPQMAIDLYNATGLRTIISCNGSGGSEWYPNGDTNNWYTSGLLYQNAKNKTKNMLIAKNRSSLDGILLILGVNDARGNQTIANIKIAMESLITRLLTDFPHTKIFVAQIGREEDGDTPRIIDVRRLIYNTNPDLVYNDGGVHGLGICQRYFNIVMAYDQMPNFTALGYMKSDRLHPNTAGHNAMGSGFAISIINTLQL